MVGNETPRRRWFVGGCVAVAFASQACSGWVGAPDTRPGSSVARDSDTDDGSTPSGESRGVSTPAAGPGDDRTGSDGAGPSPGREPSSASNADEGEPGTGTSDDPVSEPLPPEENDPGFKAIHRLNNREYDSTVSALLGIRSSRASGFLNETAYGFDNIAASLGMTVSQYTGYFRAASEAVAEAFSDPSLRDAMVECVPDEGSSACPAQIVSSFGLRAFRRPLDEDERQTYLDLYERVTGLGLSHVEAVEQVVRAMLSSAEFLYRMEFDTDPNSTRPHDLSGYELASRLSYFIWGSMPDEALFEAAGDGELVDTEQVQQHVSRMLADPRSESLVDSFTWQWLGMKDLESHAVLTEAYPDWDEPLRQSMLEEARLYLSEFVRADEDWQDFLTADFHFVDERLARHYGVSAAVRGFERRTLDDTDRVGFIGLSSFLTMSSFAHRTSPTLRAKWILEELMCSPPPPPPADLDIPDLDAAELANQAASLDNVRERLELHRSDPNCAACHSLLDPLGLALENFDGIGRFRSAYSDGTQIDPAGQLPDGRGLDGLPSLAAVVNDGDAFVECTTRKLLTYALGRGLTKPDSAHLSSLVETWKSAKTTIPQLVRHVALSIPFRQRRGGSPSPSEGVE